MECGQNRALSGYYGNKKVKGIKRHVEIDKNGFLLALTVTAAHVHDSKAALLQARVLKELLCGIRTNVADGGYRGEIIGQVKKRFGYILQTVMGLDDKKTGFKPTHKRWVMERAFSWSENERRLCSNNELLLETSEEMVKLSAIKFVQSIFYASFIGTKCKTKFTGIKEAL